ncbi:hypothetical protein IV203_031314 [Nitzschia inconspicua]|uniref:Uncharacterized protein n=1 Tax=Nitzschia inconspicua TaxID=303405 RepID=A0A9K3LWW1_9STRA|nr:hypothetical protein IV203_031314 [Nitzschia inconspicua]
MLRPDSSVSPLTVKEQFEASANRFWTSVRNLNNEETVKGKNVQEQQSRTTSSSESQEDDTVQAVSFQSVIHAVFGSCTTGASYEGMKNMRSLSTGTSTEPHSRQSITQDLSNSTGESDQPVSRRAVVKSQVPSVPTTSRTKFFQDSRDRAEEAVLHLREQQLQQQRDLERLNQQQLRQKQYEKIVSSRVSAVKSPQNANKTTLQQSYHNGHPSFFPVSKPTGRDPPGALRTAANLSVPKEVSSPPRCGLVSRNGIPTFATTYPNIGSTPGDDIFDFEDDGVSVITQITVDEMMRQQELQQRDFPNDFLLNLVYSDVTDPVNQSFRQLKQECARGEASINDLNTFLIEERQMSPPRLTRQNRSSETRSFVTKTTSSSHSDDFSAWKQEEQYYWESQVAKDESTETGFDNHHPRGTCNEQMTSRTLRSLKLQKVKEKVKRNVDRLNTGTALSLPSNNQMMYAMIRNNDNDVAEI